MADLKEILEPAVETVVKLQPVPVTDQDRQYAAARDIVADTEAGIQSQSQRDAMALKAQGQRDINLIWEETQMKVALSVVWSSLLVSVILGTFGKWLGNPDIQLAAIVFLFGVANLVTGFYFGRTNHTKTGGVGGDRISDGR